MLHTLVEQLAQAAVSLIETLGYWGILIGMTIESACIPLPSEVIMLLAASWRQRALLTSGSWLRRAYWETLPVPCLPTGLGPTAGVPFCRSTASTF